MDHDRWRRWLVEVGAAGIWCSLAVGIVEAVWGGHLTRVPIVVWVLIGYSTGLVRTWVQALVDPEAPDPVTARHRVGLATGRALDRWMSRGYRYGNFRNALSTGLLEGTRAAGACYYQQCPGRASREVSGV